MNTLQVGHRYILLNGNVMRVTSFSHNGDKDSLHWLCSDGMWRSESGEAFPRSNDPLLQSYSVDWSKS